MSKIEYEHVRQYALDSSGWPEPQQIVDPYAGEVQRLDAPGDGNTLERYERTWKLCESLGLERSQFNRVVEAFRKNGLLVDEEPVQLAALKHAVQYEREQPGSFDRAFEMLQGALHYARRQRPAARFLSTG